RWSDLGRANDIAPMVRSYFDTRNRLRFNHLLISMNPLALAMGENVKDSLVFINIKIYYNKN
ncbi:hypothetical protein, partial [Romboutsia sp.]|uniref:hypothetical protein n=1 Tax=Romboutsia sp. TaxID=1965302 RepID=UPI003F388EE0